MASVVDPTDGAVVTGDRLGEFKTIDELFDLVRVRARIDLACDRERPNCFKGMGMVIECWLDNDWVRDPEIKLRATREDIGRAVAEHWSRDAITVIHTLAPSAK